MSQMLKSCVSQLKAVEAQLRRAHYTWKGAELSPRNQSFMRDAYALMACVWMDVITFPELLNSRWVSALAVEPVDKVLELFGSVDHRLVSTFDTEASFNRWRHSEFPWAGQILAPLGMNLTYFFESGKGLGRLRSCLRLVSRANFPEPLGLEEEAWEAWKEHCLDDPVGDVPTGMVDIMTKVFPRNAGVQQIPFFRPRFGPGVTADASVKSLAEKYRSFGGDPLLDYVGFKVGFLPSEMPCNTGSCSRTHVIQFVPKKLDTLRVVSKEPSSLMFYQLGVFDYMNFVFRHSRWSNHIDLEHAELNQYLAQEGSISGEYATIDLSHASDSVKLKHVRQLFDHTCLREALIGTRSRQAEYKGELYSPTYFAPMGSGCCFPVETSMFACAVDYVMTTHCDRRAWRVYGDDIILPSNRAEELITLLESLGFEVNLTKSYWSEGPGFRESCGGDFYLGEGVYPAMLPRRWRGLRPDPRHPSTILGLVELANRLAPYKTARLRILQDLLLVKPGVIFDDEGLTGLWSSCPSNFHLRERWNSDLQRFEYYAGDLVSRQVRDEADESLRLFETLRVMEYGGSVTDGTIEIGRTGRTQWRNRWRAPAPGWNRNGSSTRVRA